MNVVTNVGSRATTKLQKANTLKTLEASVLLRMEGGLTGSKHHLRYLSQAQAQINEQFLAIADQFPPRSLFTT